MSTARVAIVGAGPAGLFAAEELLKQDSRIEIDIYEGLFAPFGLLRYGVAPDHQQIRKLTGNFQRVLSEARVRLFANLRYGEDFDDAFLQRHYHARIFATGAQSDRALGVPGEDLSGSIGARHFVEWYNAHPESYALEPRLDGEDVAIIGVGNVAIDVARILVRDRDELAKTDISARALEALRHARVRRVHIIARRGPAQVSFTLPEIRALGQLKGVGVYVAPSDLELDEASAATLDSDRSLRRIFETLKKFTETPAGARRQIHFHFLRSTREVLGQERVEGLILEKNRLIKTEDSRISTLPTGETETLSCGAVVRSIGYRGVALPGLPFNLRNATIDNVDGRVVDDGQRIEGCYVTGWARRGPEGVIGTNKADARQVVSILLEELDASEEKRPVGLDDFSKNTFPVDATSWFRLDSEEVRLGEERDKVREKFLSAEQARRFLERE